MKERPLLFNAEMVRAILDGRKTQTRRMVKPQPFDASPIIGGAIQVLWDGREDTDKFARGTITKLCPFGTVGDRLYVRETWSCMERDPIPGCEVAYKADLNGGTSQVWEPWKPSIHMPRWASRITLEITGVRVERVHDISAKDIIAEGAVERPHHDQHLGKMPVSAFDKKAYPDLRSLWAHGWNGIYKNWKDNPWVWVVEFKRITRNEVLP
jgi:hypothetical protein